MNRLRLPVTVAALTFVTLLGSCATGDSPVGPVTTMAAIAIVPRFSVAPTAEAPTINRIRLTAYASGSPPTVLATSETDVAPTATEWSVSLEVPVESGGQQVYILVELIHVAGGVATVEYSGATAPFTLVAGPAPTVQQVDVVQGPAANILVTAVTVTPDSATILEGDSVQLSASVTTSGGSSSPVVYWSSLDPQATVSATGLVRGLLPGTARIVAKSGNPADTARIVVLAVPKAVRISPDTARADSLGAVLTFTAAVLDARGAPIAGKTLVWRTLNPDLLASVGGGVFRTVRPGLATVEALLAADTTLRARAVAVTALAPVDVAVTKSADRTSAFVGDSIAYSITVRNEGGRAADGVVILESLPGNVTLISATADLGTYNAQTNGWTVGRLELGAEVHLRIVVRATAAGAASNTARLDASALPDDGIATNNQATASVTVAARLADLSVTKTASRTSALDRDSVTFTVTVSNAGPFPADSVVVGDALPSQLELLSSTASQGAYASGAWTVGTLASGASATLTMRTRVRDGVTDVTIQNVAEITRSTGATDPDSEDRTATATVSVGRRTADLSVTKKTDKASATEGDTVRFTVTVSNAGPYALSDVVLTDSVPHLLHMARYVMSQGSADTARSLWFIGPLSSGASATVTMVTVAEPGSGGQTLTNVAKIYSYDGADDPTTNDHRATASVAVSQNVADLKVTKTVDLAGPNVTQNVTFTVAIQNPSETGATGVKVTDILPAGLTFVSSSVPAGYDNTTGVWNVGDLPAGGSAQVQIVAKPTLASQGTAIVNKAKLTASIPADPNPVNDTASATVTPVNQAPTADAQSVSTPETTPIAIHLSAADLDGDSLVFSVASGPTEGTLSAFTGLVRTGAIVTYTPVYGSPGVYTFTYRVNDGVATADAVVTVTVTEVAINQSFSTPGNTELIGLLSGPDTLSRPHVYKHNGLLRVGSTLTVTDLGCGSLTCTDALGERKASGDGTFGFRPVPGAVGTQNYTFTTSNGSTATLTLTVGPTIVRYVKAGATAGGDGTSWAPFATLGDATPAGGVLYAAAGTYSESYSLAANQRLVGTAVPLVVGSDTLAPAGGTTTLTASGSGINTASGASVEGITISSPTGHGVNGTLDGVTLKDVTITSPGQAGIWSSSSAGTATFKRVTITNPGTEGLYLNDYTGTLTATEMSINVSAAGGVGLNVFGGTGVVKYSGTASATGGAFTLVQVDSATAGSVELRGGPYTAEADSAVRVKDTGASLRVDSLTINSATNIGIDIGGSSGSNGTYTFKQLTINNPAYTAISIQRGAPVVDVNLSPAGLTLTSGGRPLYVESTSGADVRVSGGPITVTGGGMGIYLGENPGSKIRFENKLDLSTGTNWAFTAQPETDGGVIEAVGAGSKISTTTEYGVYIKYTDIGPAGVTFESVETDGATYGIYLQDTGSGPFSVTGTGAAGSGGLIDNVSGVGAYFQQTGPVTLDDISIFGDGTNGVYGVYADEVDGVTVRNAEVLGSLGYWGDGCYGAGIVLKNSVGANLIENSTIGSTTDNGGCANIFVAEGTSTTTIKGNHLENAEAGIDVNPSSGGLLTVLATGNTFAGHWSGLYANTGSSGVRNVYNILASELSGGAVDVVMGGDTLNPANRNTFENGQHGAYIYVGETDTRISFDVDGNTFDGNSHEAVFAETNYDNTGPPALEGWVRNNTFFNTSVGFQAIKINVAEGLGVVEISGNTIETVGAPLATTAVAPIYVRVGTGGSSGADADVSIMGNTVFQAADAISPAIQVMQADTVPRPVCLSLKDNNVSGSWVSSWPYALESHGTTGAEFSVDGWVDNETLPTYLARINKVGGGAANTSHIFATGAFTGVAAGVCVLPGS